MSWHFESKPFSYCYWKPWFQGQIGGKRLFHLTIGEPLDFQLAQREHSLKLVALSDVIALDEPIRWLRQTHSTTLIGIGVPTLLGLPDISESVEGDGFIFRRGLTDGSIAITTADCMAIIMIAAEWGALVHAGWRGLADGIVTKAAKILSELSCGAELDIVLMPHALEADYEVGQVVMDAFPRECLKGRFLPSCGDMAEKKNTRSDEVLSEIESTSEIQSVNQNGVRFFLNMEQTCRTMIELAGIRISSWNIAPVSTVSGTSENVGKLPSDLASRQSTASQMYTASRMWHSHRFYSKLHAERVADIEPEKVDQNNRVGNTLRTSRNVTFVGVS